MPKLGLENISILAKLLKHFPHELDSLWHRMIRSQLACMRKVGRLKHILPFPKEALGKQLVRRLFYFTHLCRPRRGMGLVFTFGKMCVWGIHQLASLLLHISRLSMRHNTLTVSFFCPFMIAKYHGALNSVCIFS